MFATARHPIQSAAEPQEVCMDIEMQEIAISKKDLTNEEKMQLIYNSRRHGKNLRPH